MFFAQPVGPPEDDNFTLDSLPAVLQQLTISSIHADALLKLPFMKNVDAGVLWEQGVWIMWLNLLVMWGNQIFE